MLKKRTALVVQDRDVTVGQKLSQHGPLPTPYLKAYLPPTQRGVEMRLGDLKRHGYVYLPVQQHRPFEPRRTDPFVYANDDLMDEHLLDHGLVAKPSQTLDRNNVHHEMFLAATTASIELTAQSKGWEYLFESKLIDRAPTKSREVPCRIEFLGQSRGTHGWADVPQNSSKALIPDAYFGLNKPEGARIHFLEIDCGTEPAWTTDLDDKNWRATLLKYISFMDNGGYKTHFGVSCAALCIFIFNEDAVMRRVQKELLHITGGQGKNYMLWKTWSEWGGKYGRSFIPKEIHTAFIETPYERVGHDRHGNPHTPFYL